MGCLLRPAFHGAVLVLGLLQQVGCVSFSDSAEGDEEEGTSRVDAQRTRETIPATTAGGRGVLFTDVAADLGIGARNVSGDSEQRYVIDAMMGGAALFDYDRDGDLDLYVLNGSRVGGYEEGQDPRNALYSNAHDRFVDATDESGLGDKGWSMGCATADYNNDGDLDLYLTKYGPNVLFANQGDRTFKDVTDHAGVGDERFSTGSAFLDYDGDGDLDLYVANYVDFKDFIETTPDKSYEWRGLRVHYGPRGIKGGADVFYRNEDDGAFVDVTEEANVVDRDLRYGLGVVVGDYDNDGDPDIYVANDTGPNYLYSNNSDRTYTDVAWMVGAAYGEGGEAQGSMGIAFADYDNDGYQDIFVTNFWEQTNTLYHNDGGKFFTDRSFEAGVAEASFNCLAWGTDFFDYDNDGDKDLFVANGHIFPQLDRANLGVRYAQPNQLFENLGNGSFADRSAAAGPGLAIVKVSRGAAFGDYDNDGDVDVFVLNLNDLPTLLRNDGGNRNNWLMVETIGVKSNRDGIGARIEVQCGDVTQVSEIRSGSSYLSQNDLRAHFGLGGRDRADRVTVRWRSGLVEHVDGIAANRVVLVKEGKGIVTERN